jgi:AraC-like DNA-binding protein
VHPANLVRTFKSFYHLPLGSYARRVRLDAAARRLASTSIPAAQIAVEAGFADQSHFTRRFKQHYGMTPAHFRKRRSRSG